MTPTPRIAVLVPTYHQAAFLGRALRGLLAQTVTDWEAVVVDDGSTDRTPDIVAPYLTDPRVGHRRHAGNRGLGAALNTALGLTRAPAVAYLPSDDLWDPDHLAALLDVLADPAVALAHTGVRHHEHLVALGAPDGHPLQLVQVAHRRVPERWPERDEIESDDLERLYWSVLRRHGAVRATGRTTCTWTDHPDQRHKVIRERYDGGLNVFRRRYGVTTPLRFHSSDSGETDEPALYRRFRDRAYPPAPDGLRILLVGELAYNPERVLALAERGHRLFGLWTDDGLGMNTVGPLPFGHVADLPRQDWARALRSVRPDVVHAQLNWRAVPFAHEVLRAVPDVPFVWHYKESPQASVRRGEWPLLADLVTLSDARLFCSPEERDWFALALPDRMDPATSYVLDGDLPKADWFDGPCAARLSETDPDGAPHTVVIGRPLGMDAAFVSRLAAHGVHLHFHGLVRDRGPGGAWTSWLDEAVRAAPGRVHVHPHVDQRGWRRVLSRYDAGWLHRVRSANGGDLAVASWDDLNVPARLPALMAAGVPVLQQRRPGCAVAAERLVDGLGIGVLYDDADDVAERLRDQVAMKGRRAAVADRRHTFAFDAHADALCALLRRCAAEGPRHAAARRRA
ncbi:glycosyltransferase [Streptomyces coeruleoprunus]|uniref:Glycosyltransferase n=1 Tax=Streptomyces coeruleoprunus TaxID=285563 RepID=A0ABV9XBB7_9ACTN